MKALIALFAVTLCVPAVAQTPGQGAAVAIAPSRATADTPDGSGDPMAITCRKPQPLPGQRLYGPEVCKLNAVWARYKRDGMDVAADGIHDVPSERWRTVSPQPCHPATMGGGSTTNQMQTIFSQICE
ncbi:MAG TPA: hypothetical protein VK683_09035 [Rhizomicrobium sp.]|jgi:hypothetical protein|nr:hypothetical protein [Rhizomicrobium sp.]